ncbi:MAG: (E)-4-hydroxy-3-methylbut-2-enyl-diphosphate synthase [Prevotella sp.]|nr:(E)-4-hydroxy-3-methylbut-2-enyl-diphosphate synthase [Prevotella sp.]MBP3787628.1 (E)-4-hydroxy-3-methylbut-2-enyl-diphosphate synthase [Prevotella sp.]
MSTRRISSVAHVGNIAIGGDNPIRIQSMATTDTNDTEGSVAQAKRIIDAGGELVRFTTQGTREAENMKNISARLKTDGYTQPLVADVHFTAHTADVAAQYCEKVRINPGNYVDPGRTFKHLEYTDEEYAAELKKIEEKLVPFINICKEHHTAVRIGVNHGSLSDRIMSRYGDTPEGIVESCMEFLRIFRREQFDDVVISIKASNTVVMVTTVRLLVKTMDKEDMHYPLHLGVTEAGEGEDGRIKSAVGIGALLTEGIGDTIRVSLSEEPECEIPVARKLVELIPECTQLRAEAEASIKDDTITLTLDAPDWETLQLKAAMAVGALLIDRKATKLVIRPISSIGPMGHISPTSFVELADAILQAARIKFTKTEYISCPGCGRTLYNLQETIAKIKAATSHLVGLKIGIMGCIVNGPGEMADADYGYVGAGRGKISLYKQKVCVEKNIPEAEAVDKLLELIANDKR